MKTDKKTGKALLIFLIAASVVFVFYMCNTKNAAENGYTTIEQLNKSGKKIGVETGSTAMFAVEKELPKADIQQFTDKYSGYLAVSEGKIDAFAFERLQMELAIKNGQTGVRLLDKYCAKNKIPYLSANHIRAVFEELCRQILIPALDTVDIKFTADYSEKDMQTEITVLYGGGKFDPADTENELAHKILKGTADKMEYEYTQGERPNKVTVTIKNKI